jgi:hypothetical protein
MNYYDDRLRSRTYDVVIALLSDDEIASVNTRDAAASLSDVDEYLDLEHLDQGVRRGPGPPRPICRVLARKAVHEATWANILTWLGAMKARTLQRHTSRAPRGTRLGESRLARGSGVAAVASRRSR